MNRLGRITQRFLLLVLVFTGIACGLAAVAFHHLVDLMRRETSREHIENLIVRMRASSQ